MAVSGPSAAEAAPGGEATVVASTIAPISTDEDRDFAVCPPGQVALGGGVGTDAPDAPPAVTITASGPVDSSGDPAATAEGDVPQQWLGGIFNNSFGPVSGKVLALCSADADAVLHTGTPSVLSSVGAIFEDAINCPTGRVTGGGIQITGPGIGQVVFSGPIDASGFTQTTEDGDIAQGWFARLRHGTGGPNTYRLFIVCSQNSDAVIEASPVAPVPLLGDRTIGATCPAGRRAVGGGIGTTAAAPSAFVRSSAPVDETGTVGGTVTGDVARGWITAVSNNGAEGDGFRAFALCASEPPVDATPPETEITKGPKNRTRSRRALFEFTSEPGATFECSLDGKAFAGCKSPLKLKVKRRKHRFEVRASDAAGNVDQTPAADRWKVKRRR